MTCTTNIILRPNTSIPFQLSVPTTLKLPPISLRPHAIASLLRHYPDPKLVHALALISAFGTRLSYEGSTTVRIRRPNHSSANEHPEVIDSTIQSELQKGRIRHIASLPEYYYCSPIGLVLKKIDGVQTGWRMIFDLSCPTGASVNDGIPPKYGEISYEPLEKAIKLVAKAGRGAVMMKRDLKAAFRHIPVSPVDYWLLIFQWNDKFYADLFLPFGLRTAPRIFNLFSEALHWVFESLLHWDLTHYLDDFLFVFPSGTELKDPAKQYEKVLATFGFAPAPEKDMNGQVVTHLGFELDSNAMEVRLPQNKRLRALKAVNDLQKAHTVTHVSLEETLGFLSHCCTVVPLGRPFLRELYSLLHRLPSRKRLHLHSAAKRDLKWWTRFLTAWPSVSLIQTMRTNHDVATDASSLHGIGGIYNGQLFSVRVSAKHHAKHINVKEMLAILHAFLLWHEHWTHGHVRLACDNSAVVDAIRKRSIKGDAIRPLQAILLIAAIFDIELTVFWLPSEENIVADAASRFDYKKLANLGFQDQLHSLRHPPPSHRTTTLRQKLHSFYSARWQHQHGGTTNQFRGHTSDTASSTTTINFQPPSNPSLTGSPKSCATSDPQPLRHMPARYDHYISATTTIPQPSTTPESISFSNAGTRSSEKVHVASGYRSHRIFSPGSSQGYQTTRMASISKRRSVWHLPDSFDLVSLHGRPGIPHPHGLISHANMSSSTQTAPSHSRFRPQRPIPITEAQTFNSLKLPPFSAQSEPSPHCFEHNPNNPMTLSSHLRTGHSIDPSSSEKSKSFCFEQASTPQTSQDTRYAKEQPFQQQHVVSLKRKSNC